MDAEIKKKLEEMAVEHSFFSDPVFMAGCQAAWKMATELAMKAERERIYAELNRKTAMGHSEIQAILNPPKDEAEK